MPFSVQVNLKTPTQPLHKYWNLHYDWRSQGHKNSHCRFLSSSLPYSQILAKWILQLNDPTARLVVRAEVPPMGTHTLVCWGHPWHCMHKSLVWSSCMYKCLLHLYNHYRILLQWLFQSTHGLNFRVVRFHVRGGSTWQKSILKHIVETSIDITRRNVKICQNMLLSRSLWPEFSPQIESISMGFEGSSLLSSDKQNSSHLHDQNASKPKREFLGDEVPTTTHNKWNYATNVISGGGGSFKCDQSWRQQGRWKEGVVSLTCIGRKSLEFSFFTSIYVSGRLSMFKSLIYNFELHDCIIITDYVVMTQ